MSDSTRHDTPERSASESFWEERYSGNARVWKGTPNPLLVEAAEALTPGTALDLGCGEGGDAVWLARQGWQVTAVDVAPTAVRRTAAHAADAGVADRVAAEQHDLARTFPAGSFDLISAQYLQTPIEFPRPAVLRQAAGALTPTGLLILVDHGSVRPWGWQPDPDYRFPTPQELYDELELDPARWYADRLDTPRREATGPSGEIATVTDTVVVVRRR
jgi:SAM-dependent methyltransferase